MSCWKIQRACCSARRPIGLCPRVYCRKTAKVSGIASERLQRRAAAQACELGNLGSQVSHIEEVPALGIFHGDGKVSGGQENLQENTRCSNELCKRKPGGYFWVYSASHLLNGDDEGMSQPALILNLPLDICFVALHLHDSGWLGHRLQCSASLPRVPAVNRRELTTSPLGRSLIATS